MKPTTNKKLPRNARRWLSALVVHLRKDSTAVHFDLGCWYERGLFQTEQEAEASLRRIAREDKAGHCGATACAIGWLPALFPRSFGWECSEVWHLSSGSCFDEGADIFGISEDEFDHLFMPRSYPAKRGSAKDVARRIDRLLKRYA